MLSIQYLTSSLREARCNGQSELCQRGHVACTGGLRVPLMGVESLVTDPRRMQSLCMLLCLPQAYRMAFRLPASSRLQFDFVNHPPCLALYQHTRSKLRTAA